MAPSIRLIALLGAIAAQAAAQAGFSTSTLDTTTVDIFVVKTGGATPTIEASIVTATPSMSETVYRINCPFDTDGLHNSAPCDMIDGALVTVDQTRMNLKLVSRVSINDVVADFTGGTTTQTAVTVDATVGCRIEDATSVSCFGHVTSDASTLTYEFQGETASSIGTVALDHDIETITTSISGSDAVRGHMIPITVTAGMEKLQTTSTSTVPTWSSTGGVPRATGLGHGQAVIAGALALAGGVALL